MGIHSKVMIKWVQSIYLKLISYCLLAQMPCIYIVIGKDTHLIIICPSVYFFHIKPGLVMANVK